MGTGVDVPAGMQQLHSRDSLQMMGLRLLHCVSAQPQMPWLVNSVKLAPPQYSPPNTWFGSMMFWGMK